jgi:transcriptional repressor NrdR
MKCPYCGHAETAVIDSRETEELESVRRRRECEKCGKRFTTYEHVELLDLTVLKKDGKKEQFDRNKLKNGIAKACYKTPISNEEIEKLVESVEMDLRSRDSTEIKSEEVGELVMKKLKKVNKVAFIRYSSVYREFADVEEFKKELDNLLKK